MRRFEEGHPLVSFLYFFVIIGMTILYWHPFLLGISVVGGILYSLFLKGGKGFLFHIKVTLPMVLLAAVINPLFNHQGITVLFQINGHSITKESIMYGFAAAAMIYSVCLWFACYQKVITSDRFMALFGKRFPSLTLIFSMVLGFLPRFFLKRRQIKEAQQFFNEEEKGMKRIKSETHQISGLTTWALESSVDTADSMAARGYGSGKRSHYGRFHFIKNDGITLIWMIGLCVFLIYGVIKRIPKYWYFPELSSLTWDSWFYVAFILFIATPLFRNVWEEIRWNYILWRK